MNFISPCICCIAHIVKITIFATSKSHFLNSKNAEIYSWLKPVNRMEIGRQVIQYFGVSVIGICCCGDHLFVATVII